MHIHGSTKEFFLVVSTVDMLELVNQLDVEVGSEKSIPVKVEKKLYDGRAALLQGDASFKAPYWPVSPLPARHNQNVEGHGLQQAVPVTTGSYLLVLSLSAGYPRNVEGYGLGQVVPLQPLDCFMCQKALPHAHSDTVVQDHHSVVSDASMVFHSVRPGDAMRPTPCRVMTGPMDSENLVLLGDFASHGFAQIPETRHENRKLVVPNAQSPDHSKAMRPRAAIGLPSSTQALNGMYANIPQARRQDSLQQQQQQPSVQPFGQPLLPVKKDGFGLGEPYGSGVYPIRNVNLQAPGPLNLVHAPEVPYNYDSQVNGKMQALLDSQVNGKMQAPEVIMTD